MAVSIQNPVKCEVRAVIRFLHAKGETAAEIHRQLVSVYGEDVMNWQNGVVNWKRDDEGHPLSLMRSSKEMMRTFVLTDV
jgi:hypothetical protein